MISIWLFGNNLFFSEGAGDPESPDGFFLFGTGEAAPLFGPLPKQKNSKLRSVVVFQALLLMAGREFPNCCSLLHLDIAALLRTALRSRRLAVSLLGVESGWGEGTGSCGICVTFSLTSEHKWGKPSPPPHPHTDAPQHLRGGDQS